MPLRHWIIIIILSLVAWAIIIGLGKAVYELFT